MSVVSIEKDEFGEVDGVGGHALAAGHALAFINLADVADIRGLG
jgi:hypothetical protein